MYDDLQGLLIW